MTTRVLVYNNMQKQNAYMQQNNAAIAQSSIHRIYPQRPQMPTTKPKSQRAPLRHIPLQNMTYRRNLLILLHDLIVHPPSHHHQPQPHHPNSRSPPNFSPLFACPLNSLTTSAKPSSSVFIRASISRPSYPPYLPPISTSSQPFQGSGRHSHLCRERTWYSP
jgi:hypothetical protein